MGFVTWIPVVSGMLGSLCGDLVIFCVILPNQSEKKGIMG
jgi:hypothetical protein